MLLGDASRRLPQHIRRTISSQTASGNHHTTEPQAALRIYRGLRQGKPQLTDLLLGPNSRTLAKSSPYQSSSISGNVMGLLLMIPMAVRKTVNSLGCTGLLTPYSCSVSPFSVRCR